MQDPKQNSRPIVAKPKTSVPTAKPLVQPKSLPVSSLKVQPKPAPTTNPMATKKLAPQPQEPAQSTKQPQSAQTAPESETKPQSAQGALTADQIFAMAKMAYTQWQFGKLDRARSIFQTLVTQRPNEPWFRCALGSVYQKEKKFSDAVKQYNIALSLNPQEIVARVNRGEILLKVGKKAEAFHDLKSAISADATGKHPSALRAKALLAAAMRPPVRMVQLQTVKAPAATAKLNGGK